MTPRRVLRQSRGGAVFSLPTLLRQRGLKAEVLKGTRCASQIRLQLFKIAARVRLSCRRMHFALASAYPYWHDFAKAHSNLQTAGFT